MVIAFVIVDGDGGDMCMDLNFRILQGAVYSFY